MRVGAQRSWCLLLAFAAQVVVCELVIDGKCMEASGQADDETMASLASAEHRHAGRQTPHVFSGSRMRMRFLMWMPPDFGPTSGPYPLLAFLHGAGESGDDVDRIKLQGPPKLVEQHPHGKLGSSFVVVSPQSQHGQFSSLAESTTVAELIEYLLRLPSASSLPIIDASRVYLTGVSMGGYGKWAIAHRHAHLFAAIAPICGGGMKEWAETYQRHNIAVWAFHGANDIVIPVRESDKIVGELRRLLADVEYSRFEQAPGRDPNWLPVLPGTQPTAAARHIPTMQGHASWVPAYEGGTHLWDWLLSKQRAPVG